MAASKRLPPVPYQGKPWTLTALAKHLGMGGATLKKRLAMGMTVEEAIAYTPNAHGKRTSAEDWYASIMASKLWVERREFTADQMANCIHAGKSMTGEYLRHLWQMGKCHRREIKLGLQTEVTYTPRHINWLTMPWRKTTPENIVGPMEWRKC